MLQNNLPEKGKAGDEVILQSVDFKPRGTGSGVHSNYAGELFRNRYTFQGTFYTIYLELDGRSALKFAIYPPDRYRLIHI